MALEMSYLDILQKQLPIDEGVRYAVYMDTRGIPTIGVGRNLRDVGVRADEVALMLKNDIATAETGARALFAAFDALTEERKAVLVNMVFNMGKSRLAGFHKLIAAVEEQRWDDAAREMLDSDWAQQVGDRAQRLAAAMRA